MQSIRECWFVQRNAKAILKKTQLPDLYEVMAMKMKMTFKFSENIQLSKDLCNANHIGAEGTQAQLDFE